METAGSPKASSGVKSTPPSKAKTVLIVEPIPDQQWKLARIFTVGGFRVIGTSGVGGAQALLKTCPVDLILLSADACEDMDTPPGETFIRWAPDTRVLVMRPDAPGEQPARPAAEYVNRPQRISDVTLLAAS